MINRILLCTVLIFTAITCQAKEVWLTDSFWRASIEKRTKQIEKQIHNAAKNGSITVFKHPRSNSMPVSAVAELGSEKLMVAGDGKDSVLEVHFQEKYFAGMGFYRIYSHDLINASTSTQLTHISLLYRLETPDFPLSTTSLYYVSLKELESLLSSDNLKFIKCMDLISRESGISNLNREYGNSNGATNFEQERTIEYWLNFNQPEWYKTTYFTQQLCLEINKYIRVNKPLFDSPKLKNEISRIDFYSAVWNKSDSTSTVMPQKTSPSDELRLIIQSEPENTDIRSMYNKSGRMVLEIAVHPVSDKYDQTDFDQERTAFVAYDTFSASMKDYVRIVTTMLIDHYLMLE